MKQLLVGAVVAFGLASTALAGDAVAGKTKALACTACHGADGNSMMATFPKLAGQNERYLIKQMNDIKSGARPVPTMTGQLDAKSDEDIADIAAFFAGQNMSGNKADPELAKRGEEIYRAGISSKGVAACTACHMPSGEGNGPAGFPRLGGQHADYIATQLKAFRLGADQPNHASARTNDGDTRIMRDVASRLSDLEIDAVSSYISGLH